MKYMRSLALVCLLLLACAYAADAQDTVEPRSRDITSDDFVKKRPAQTSSNRRTTNQKRYKYARKTKSYRRRNSSRKAKPNANVPAKEQTAQIGVTMWQLRPPRTGETGPFLPVQTSNGFSSMWTPERVSTDKQFLAGDRIRFAVESSAAGYLYIVDSEVYEDGTIGDPYLVFPGSEGIDNRVSPGTLVDIPDQDEENPYFLIETKRKDYKGELLLVIITPRPLKTLKTDGTGRITSIDILEEIEDYADAEIFNRIDGLGEALTLAESQAACGSKARRKAFQAGSANPCDVKTRQLTRESPPPQTIFRTKYRIGQPIAFPFLMNVGENN